MTQFTDGPAAGKALMLKRSPLYLRVVQGAKGQFDGLDQLIDTPSAGEFVIVYRRVSLDGHAMVDWTEGGRRRGGCFPCATYAVVAEQPDQGTATDTEKWRAWCYARQKLDSKVGAA